NTASVLVQWLGIASVWAATAVGAEYMKYKDPNQPVGVRVEDLLMRMTLEEKIGQMVQIDRTVATADIMRDYYIGSLLSGGGSTPLPGATATDWVNMVNKFQKGSLSTRLGIPMIYGIDAVHGHNNVVNATIFPHNVGLGATRQVNLSDVYPFRFPTLIYQVYILIRMTVGFNHCTQKLFPDVMGFIVSQVCRDPRWGRCYESYSEDPKIVREMTEIILGLQGEIPSGSSKGVPYVGGNILFLSPPPPPHPIHADRNKVVACAKHFVGDGGTTKGINEDNTLTDMHGLLSIHMPAYDDSIIKGVSTIMVSYSSWNGEKMHANRNLITGFLKDTLKFKTCKKGKKKWTPSSIVESGQFQGFVISDWEGIDRITSPPHSNYTYSVQASVLAGIDMVMIPLKYTEFIDELTSLVKNNFVPMDRIDDAVRRILLVKFISGLFENPVADFSLVNEVGNQVHRELAREAVRKSLVLLKNGKNAEDPLLPLSKKVPKILVAGSHADNLGYQCGGWTINWQGFSGNNYTSGTTIYSAIVSTVEKGTEVVYRENPDSEYVKSGDFSYGIVVVGEHPYTESAGDSLTLTMADPGPDVINNVCGAVECVVIVISGRPIVIEPYISFIDALVAAWLPGSEGQGVTDVLFGDYDFTGNLSRTWFKTVDQLPMNVGDPHYDPLFPFGFGLTTKSVVER
ncbi:hypothetical protein RJ639_019717, partial [Escallonia herrerae]